MKKKSVVIVTLVVVLCFVMFFTARKSRIYAEDTPTLYYKEYMVQNNDTLWSLAGEYKWDGCSTKEYIELVKQINNLSNDVINYGEYIILPYTR